MSFNKNQKNYNKQVMQTGQQANKYLQNALGLINQYTTNYSDRLDFYTNKLNNRYLDLMSDKYLQQNAQMLRGAAQFGSNSALNQQINENAYSQQNALANIQNANVAAANQLQNNELQALFNASKAYQNPISMGATAAQNVDAANSGIFSTVGKGLQAVGTVAGIFNPVVGSAISGVGGVMSGLSTPLTSYTQDQMNYYTGQFANMQNALNKMGIGYNAQNLSTQGNNTNSTLSSTSAPTPSPQLRPYANLRGDFYSNINGIA